MPQTPKKAHVLHFGVYKLYVDVTTYALLCGLSNLTDVLSKLILI